MISIDLVRTLGRHHDPYNDQYDSTARTGYTFGAVDPADCQVIAAAIYRDLLMRTVETLPGGEDGASIRRFHIACAFEDIGGGVPAADQDRRDACHRIWGEA